MHEVADCEFELKEKALQRGLMAHSFLQSLSCCKPLIKIELTLGTNFVNMFCLLQPEKVYLKFETQTGILKMIQLMMTDVAPGKLCMKNVSSIKSRHVLLGGSL